MLAESLKDYPTPLIFFFFFFGGQEVVREVIYGLSPRVSLVQQGPDRENKRYKNPEVERCFWGM